MKLRTLVVAFVVVAFAAGVTLAAAPKTYQVTGPVLEVSADKVVVQKGKDKWELGLDKDTKGAAGLKVGDKVTIEYRMYAATVTVKTEKAVTKTTTTTKPATTKMTPKK